MSHNRFYSIPEIEMTAQVRNKKSTLAHTQLYVQVFALVCSF